jgi:SAM-dependent methyltransferase
LIYLKRIYYTTEMIVAGLYILLLLLELAFLIGFTVYTIFLIYSGLKGSPYVPTKSKEAEFILKEIGLEKNKVFYDLGCGDARVVRKAVSQYHVKGVGIDVNPILITYARFLARIRGLKDIKLKVKNLFDTDLSQADVVYLFLMPGLLKKLIPKFERELKKTALVVSHGFLIEGWEKNMVKKIPHTPFPTYFYRRP